MDNGGKQVGPDEACACLPDVLNLEPNENDKYKGPREELVRCLARKGVNAPRVLEAIAKVPRHCLISPDFVHHAYEDAALPIREGQTISQPYVVAKMTEAVVRNKDVDKLLEIGTGSGYQSAIAAEVVERVFTVERCESLFRETRARLRDLGYDNIHFRRADGSRGWPSFAPYDAIIVTAACREIPRRLIDQLAEGGRLVAPVGDPSALQTLTLVTRHNGRCRERGLSEVKFVPLIEDADGHV